MSILKSILDTDLYKLTMQQAILHYRQNTPVEYMFYNRRKDRRFNNLFVKKLCDEIDRMRHLYLTNEEADWLKTNCPWLGKEYISYLGKYRYDPDEVTFDLSDGEIELKINGDWERAVMWEVPLMAVISELYFKYCDINWNWDDKEQTEKLFTKAEVLFPTRYADFGTRRRRSYQSQDYVVKYFSKDWKSFFGTSNVHFAMKYKVRPVGTMAHEWIMGISATEGLLRANHRALSIWSEVYKGDLGIALTDTFGTEAFFKDFDGYLARLFDGVRHDSGDPYKFVDRVVEHYKSLGIDPKGRIIVFSDGLDAHKAYKLYHYCKDKILCSFGISTNFTNDIPNSKPLEMVIKLNKCNNVPVVKLSDVPTKSVGDKDALRVAKWTFFNTPLD